MLTGPETPKNPINIEGKTHKNSFVLTGNLATKEEKWKSVRGWMLPNIIKFRYQI